LHKGLNVIIGESDSGKSAILRALRWVIANKPSGDAYRRRVGGTVFDTDVKIVTDNGTVKKVKGKGVNLYQLDDQVFKAFGKDIPKEVQDCLNMYETNIQRQLDTPFLLSDSPGVVAQHFNKVANLDKIDKGQTNIQREISTLNKDIKYIDGEIESKKTQLTEFPNLKMLDRKIKQVERKQEKLDKIDDEGVALQSLTNDLSNIEGELVKYGDVETALNDIYDLMALQDSLGGKMEDYHNLSDLGKAIVKTTNKINALQNTIKAEGEIDEVLKLHNSLKEKDTQLSQLEKLYKDTISTTKSLTEEELKLGKLEEEYHKNFPDICPLCNHTTKR